MAHEHLGIHNTELAEIIVTYDTAIRAANEITAHFRQQQAAWEEKQASAPVMEGQNAAQFRAANQKRASQMLAKEHQSPFDLLQDAKTMCQELLDKLEGCPVKMTADRLQYILTAADGDLEAAAEMINEQMFEALK